ncbi:MAG: glycosyltransferase [Gammaproteobacteria bacterium]|nr:glycosyltransferase [Gammaproteobacteria bacterium]
MTTDFKSDTAKSTAAEISLISMVIPVYNEEANLTELINRCVAVGDALAFDYELILVDDGSADSSAQMIQQAAEDKQGKVVGVLLNRNYGQHAAVMAGLAQSRGDVVVTLDADLQNPPEEIPKLIEKSAQGFDVVGSVRMNRKDSFFRRTASKIINKAVQKATGVMMTDYGCMLRAYHRNIVNAMLQCHERSTFIPVLANTFARQPCEVPVAHAGRSQDETKYSIMKLINLQFDLLTSMTTFPLRLLSILGGLLALAGFAFSIVLLVTRLVYGAAWAGEGVFTVFAILFIFIGVQLLAMGLLGEYIGRIYHDVRARPRYFIHKVVGISE